MAGRLSSPRFRRRVLRVSAVGAIVGVAAVISIVFWNTGQDFSSPLSDEPAVVPTVERQVAIPKSEYEQALNTAARFVATAVRRERTGESFDLVSPALRSGYTRAEWAEGEIPVQPYPVDVASWRLQYQYEKELGLEVYVVPKRGSQLEPTVFLVTMRKGPERRWLVDAWLPQPGAAPVSAAPRQAPASGGIVAGQLPVTQPEGRIPRFWLFVPAFLLVGVILVPVVLMLLERRRTRRAERAYALASAERSSSSSKPS